MAYENFTTYTEVDNVNDRLQVAAAHIDHNCHRDEETYVYKDFTADHFGDFEHLVDGRFVSGQWVIYVWALANIIDDMVGIEGALGDAIGVYFYTSSSFILLREVDGGDVYTDISDFNFTDNVWYYFRIKKVGTALTCKIYDAATRLVGDLLDTLTLTLKNDYKFRYLYPAQSHTLGAHAEEAVGDIANLELQEPTLLPDGIASAEAFGTLAVVKLLQIVSPDGIASAEAFGTATLQLYLITTGITSVEAFGTPTIVMIVEPVAIASSEAFGTLTLEIYLIPTGITSSETFGTLTTVMIVEPSAITTSEVIGTSHVRVEVDPQNHTGSVGWADEEKAYDERLGTFASDTIPAASESDWLTVNRELALTCSRIRVWYRKEDADIGDPTVEVHRDGAWVEV